MESILGNLRTSQLLRISCSDIAGVTGFNPWSKVDELFEKYLYQDLDELLIQDAECLDTEFLTTEQEVQKILQKIDSKDKEQLDAIDAVTKDSSVLNNNAKAEDMLKQIQQLMKDSGMVNKISSTELKFIENEFKGRVRKNYGIHCENPSLDKYEHVMGFPVTERNMDTLKMKIMPEVPSAHVPKKSSRTEGGEDFAPVDAFAVLINGSKRLSKELALAALNGGVKKRRTGDKPAFVLIGRVDGVSRQLDMSSEDAAQWGETKVVVEMKSRVRAIASPPPLYEQIQLVAYMIMLGCPCGDLVQSVAKKVERATSTTVLESRHEVICVENETTATSSSCGVSIEVNQSCTLSGSSDSAVTSAVTSAESTPSDCGVKNSTETSTDSTATCMTHTTTSCTSTIKTESNSTMAISTSTSTTSTTCISHASGQHASKDQKPRRHDPSVLYSDEEFQINRIQLDGPPYYHRKYWDNVVLPRLRLFRDAVAVMRSDDSIRYAYLMSGPEEKFKMLQNLCPYFDA